MRHFGSLLVAAVFAPSIFLLTGTGLSAFNSALDDNSAFDPLGSLAALGALLLAGVLYGILVMARLSPLGPGLAGLASLGISGWALLDIEAYRESFSMLDVHMGGALGESGLGIMLGIPLIATIFSGRRWRRNELYAPQAMPVRPLADPAWMPPGVPASQPAQPLEMPLPDIPPPSLRYPASSAFQAPTAPTASSWRTPPYVPPISESASRASASGPPGDETQTAALPAAAPPAPPAPTPPPTPAPTSGAPGSGTSGTPVADLPAMESMAEKLMSWSASSPPDSAPAAPIVMATPDEAPPLPRRVPSPPPRGKEVTAPISSSPPPADNEDTEHLGTPGSVAPQAKPTSEEGDQDDTVQSR